MWRERIKTGIAQTGRTRSTAALYRALAELEEDERLAEVYRRLATTEERSHARLLASMSGGSGVAASALGRLEGRHRAASGNALRAAVLKTAVVPVKVSAALGV